MRLVTLKRIHLIPHYCLINWQIFLNSLMSHIQFPVQAFIYPSLVDIAMISPAGVHLMNGNLGPNRDQVLMVIQALNVSDFLEERKQYIESEKNGCSILSDRYVKINTIHSHELFWQCGPNQVDKIINYFFASGNKIIVVGLKGSGSFFDNNLEKFRNSVRTLSINEPADISKIR